MVTREDMTLAQNLVEELYGAFISGSWLVSQGAVTDKPPSDIDVVVSAAAFHPEARDRVQFHHDLSPEATEQSAKYNTDENDADYELVANWRKDGVNLIIVNDKFYAAYKAARDILEEKPALFTTREQRVNLHHRLKAHVRDMFGEYAWMKFYQSSVPLSLSDLE